MKVMRSPGDFRVVLDATVMTVSNRDLKNNFVSSNFKVSIAESSTSMSIRSYQS